MKKSYDIRDDFSPNQKEMIKDQFNYSPAGETAYDYKKCIVRTTHIGADVVKQPDTHAVMATSKKQRSNAERMASLEGSEY